MSTKKITIGTHSIDSEGDQFSPKCIFNMKNAKVFNNRDHSKCMGKVMSVRHEENEIVAEILPTGFLSGWAAMGFRVVEAEKNEHGGRTFKEIDLYEVSINDHPNVDPNVPKI